MFGVVDGIGNQIAQDPFTRRASTSAITCSAEQIHQQLDTGLLGQVADREARC